MHLQRWRKIHRILILSGQYITRVSFIAFFLLFCITKVFPNWFCGEKRSLLFFQLFCTFEIFQNRKVGEKKLLLGGPFSHSGKVKVNAGVVVQASCTSGSPTEMAVKALFVYSELCQFILVQMERNYYFQGELDSELGQ